MNFEIIRQQRWYTQLEENKRLQWMLLAVVCIVLLSVGKGVSDAVMVRQDEVIQQRQMLEKLLTAAARPIDAEKVEAKADDAAALEASGLKANSASVAEAQALKRIDELTTKHLTNPQASLINTETLQFGDRDAWQIRIEVRGKLDEKKLIPLLTEFDGSNPYQRISSFQYRPNAANTITLVVDYLYLRDAA